MCSFAPEVSEIDAKTQTLLIIPVQLISKYKIYYGNFFNFFTFNQFSFLIIQCVVTFWLMFICGDFSWGFFFFLFKNLRKDIFFNYFPFLIFFNLKYFTSLCRTNESVTWD